MNYKPFKPSEAKELNEKRKLEEQRYAEKRFNFTVKRIDKLIKKHARMGCNAITGLYIKNYYLRYKIMEYYEGLGYKIDVDYSGIEIGW